MGLGARVAGGGSRKSYNQLDIRTIVNKCDSTDRDGVH